MYSGVSGSYSYKRGGVRDGFVEDREDRRGMSLRLAVDEFHRLPWMYLANSPLDMVLSR